MPKQAIEEEQADSSDDEGIMSMKGANSLSWSDFNVDFHSSTPNIEDKKYA